MVCKGYIPSFRLFLASKNGYILSGDKNKPLGYVYKNARVENMSKVSNLESSLNKIEYKSELDFRLKI